MRTLHTAVRAFLAVLLAAGSFAAAAAAPAGAGEPAAKAAASVNYQGLWWRKPGGSESGWGVNFAHQGDFIFATWFTYDADGKPWWLIAELARNGSTATYSGPVSTVKGVPFASVPWDVGKIAETAVGTMSVTFADARNATMAYTVNGSSRTVDIELQAFGEVPACTWGASASALAQAINYQDLWWASPAGVEAGWGINLTHQGNIVFATWFTYDAAGKPWWLIAELHKGPGKTYTGPVSTVQGLPFNAASWDPAKIVETEVGTMEIAFADGNAAVLDYTVDGKRQVKNITRQVFGAGGTQGTACTPPDNSAAFVSQLADLAGRANRGEIGSEAFTTQLTAILAAIDAKAGGVEQMLPYVETAVLGRTFTFSPAATADRLHAKAIYPADLAAVKASRAYQLLLALANATQFLAAPNPAGSLVAATDAPINILLSGIVVRVKVLDALAAGTLATESANQYLALVPTNPFTAWRNLLQGLGLPVPAWLAGAPGCVSGCGGPSSLHYGGPVTGTTDFSISIPTPIGTMSCSARATFTGTVDFKLTVTGEVVDSGSVTVVGKVVISNSTNATICPPATYDVVNTSPVSGKLSSLVVGTATGSYPGTVSVVVSGNTISGSYTMQLMAGVPPFVATFTATLN